MDRQIQDENEFDSKLIGYFKPGVLAPYKTEPDKYVVATDNFEGGITLTNAYSDKLIASGNTQERIDVRFGYRTLKSGDLVIAAYMPSLSGYRGQTKKSRTHQNIWEGFRVVSSEWTTDSDERFRLWVQRYANGDFNVQNGPRRQLEEVIQTISALTSEVLGCSLFKFPKNPALSFPLAQNTHAYQDAHRELYGYVIDGLDISCIDKIASRNGMSLKSHSKKTMCALRSALPKLPTTTTLWPALDTVSGERGTSAHSVRPPASKFPAFERFNQDLVAVVAGLRELLNHLEVLLNMSGETASTTQIDRSGLPKIDRDPERALTTNCSINQIREVVGKTIERVDFGHEVQMPESHEGEVIILYFTDGSILGISIESNALDVATEHEAINPGDIRVDFKLRWVLPLGNSNVPTE